MPNPPVERLYYDDDENQFFELWRPQREALGSAIFVHGGFWRAKYDLHHADPFCAALSARGIVTASVEYRRMGQPGGGWPATFQDVSDAVRTASARLDSLPVLIGHSAGGHLALSVAAVSTALKAVVALAPVADLRLAYKLNLSNGAVVEFLGGTPASVPDRYHEACPSHRASHSAISIVHGTEDEDVPVQISRAFLDARMHDPEPPRLLELPGTGHMELIDPGTTAGATVIDLIVRVAQE